MPRPLRMFAAGCCLLTGGLLALRVPAQTPAPIPVSAAPPTPVPDKKKYGDLHLVEPNYDAKTDITTGRNFKYTEDDMVVTGNAARYQRNKKMLLATGNLIMDDPKHHVTGGKADVDHGKKKLAIITENVIIVIKPDAPNAAANPDANVNAERKQGVVITCDRVEDYYKRRFAILRGHLIFKQKVKKADGKIVERTMTAEHAEYDGRTEQMHLFTPVHGSDTDGQEATYEKDVYVGTKEGEETIKSDGAAQYKFLNNDTDEQSDDTQGEKPNKPQK